MHPARQNRGPDGKADYGHAQQGDAAHVRSSPVEPDDGDLDEEVWNTPDDAERGEKDEAASGRGLIITQSCAVKTRTERVAPIVPRGSCGLTNCGRSLAPCRARPLVKQGPRAAVVDRLRLPVAAGLCATDRPRRAIHARRHCARVRAALAEVSAPV
jgi:hypothetical protein